MNKHLPEEWEIKKIGDILKVKHGKNQRDVEVKNGKYPILGTGGVIGRTNSFLYDKPSVLIGRKGTIDRPQFMEKPFWTVDTLFYTDIKNDIDPKWLYYKFCTIPWKRYNEATGVPSLSASTIHSIKIEIPTLIEQKKIAAVLTTWDKVIDLKQKQIEQKKEQKKGLMQKLLTGEVRLRGFEGEWKVVRIRDLSSVVTGTTPSTKNKDYYENGTYPWITPTDITDSKYISNSERKLTEKGIEKGRFVPAGSLLITCIASIGKNAILTIDGSCNQQINAILPSKQHSNEFLYYKLKQDIKRMEILAGKSATAIINKNTFENFKVSIPELEEQKAIAKVLSVIDDSIELSLKEVEQLKIQKKGLMQLLLTGKVRIRV
jgi:type I restriction enzyme, S subunit